MKNLFPKFQCQKCKEFSSYSIIKFIRHLKREHNSTMTAKDWKFAFRYHIITQILIKIFSLPLLLIIIVLRFILMPFNWLYEFLDSFI